MMPLASSVVNRAAPPAASAHPVGERRIWSRTNLPIALVLLASLVLNSTGLAWGLPNYVDWAPDSVAPYRVLQALFFHFSNGWWDKYPPLHLALIGLLYVPYLVYLKLSGGIGEPSRFFPFGLTDPLGTVTALILIARVVSALAGTAIVLLVYLVVRHLFGRRAAIFSSLIVALSYPFVYYAHTGNVDVPYLFWSLLAILWFVRVLERGALPDYALFALFVTLAICTKDMAYGLFLLCPVAILWRRFTEGERTAGRALRVLLDRRNLVAVGVAAIAFALIHNLPLNFRGFVKHLQFIVGPGSENYRAFSPTLAGRVQLLRATLGYLADAFTLPLVVASVAGSVYCALRFPRRTLPLLLIPLGYYLFFLNALLNSLPRFVLPIGIVLSFFGGKLLANLWDSRRTVWRRFARAAIAAAFAYAAVFAVQVDYLMVHDSRYAAERWLAEHARPGAIIETWTPPTLYNYYPRFPSWVKVRGSRLEAGTAWDTRVPSRERVQMPNLYAGEGDPDYIVLSEIWYYRFVEDPETREAEVLRELFRGDLGFRAVANFYTAPLVPIRDLFMNPRILIFEKTPVRAGS
jgi:hypothetical protein